MDIKDKIDKVFNESKNQVEALLAIYGLFIPDWDKVCTIKNWPTVGKKLSDYIWNKFILFDIVHHPDFTPGGLWLNKGFSSDDKLDDWSINISTCEIQYKS